MQYLYRVSGVLIHYVRQPYLEPGITASHLPAVGLTHHFLIHMVAMPGPWPIPVDTE